MDSTVLFHNWFFSQVPSQCDQCTEVGAFHVCLRFYSDQCLLLWQTPERKDLTGRRVPVAPFQRSQPWLTGSAALAPPPALNLMLGRHGGGKTLSSSEAWSYVKLQRHIPVTHLLLTRPDLQVTPSTLSVPYYPVLSSAPSWWPAVGTQRMFFPIILIWEILAHS